MLNIDRLTYRIGGRVLFDAASAQIPAGRRVGLVGRNGSGKSTLLALIRGELQADGGSVSIEKRARLGFVAQEAPGGTTTPLEHVLAADTERAALLEAVEHGADPDGLAEAHERLFDIDAHTAPSRAASILAGLGFDTERQNQALKEFSGGWRMRVGLAAALFAAPDLLLLDEPTNHLDLEASLWLESYLSEYPRTLLLVSHDRSILNSCVTHILHIEDLKLTQYAGDYDSFERQRQARRAQSAALAAKQEAQRKHIQSFIDRFRAKATKARQAQSRIKALARLAPVAAVPDDPSVSFVFPEAKELKPPILTMDGASVGYEPGKPVLRGLDLRLDPDDRVALLGANGNGKSTLAKLIAGRLDAMAGSLRRSSGLKVGFFAQHQIEDMTPERTAFQEMAAQMPDARVEQVRARLGRFGFSQQKAEVKVADLSGGEKARLNFALITVDAPNLLILDEPTNHLDLPSREALAEALDDYAGAVILVTHDWHLIELTADRLWLVSGGRVRPFEGDLEDYKREMLAERATQAGSKRPPEPPKPRLETPRPAANLPVLRKAAREAEQALARLNAEKAEVELALAAPETYRDSARASTLGRRRSDLTAAIAAAEERWLAASQALEDAGASV